jgi:hypothetical protein
MPLNRHRIIFILIFMLASDGTHNGAAASDIETTKQLTNEMENAQSGELPLFTSRCNDNLARTYAAFSALACRNYSERVRRKSNND